MVQIPIINGIYTDTNSDFRTSYPVNLIPVPKQQGISEGYLRPSEGVIALNSTTGGVDRGGYNWLDVHYRVIGTFFYSVAPDGTLTNLGAIGGSDKVKFAQSFDQIAICANKILYYYDGVTLEQVTDEDLGESLDVIWIDGYFVSTDGEFIVVSDLNDPTSFDQLKFGSSEVDPDPIVALHKVRNEIYAVNRDTIEVFNNTGGQGFPFSRIPSAQITRGAVSRDCTAQYDDSIVFVGGRRNEALAVWIGANGSVQKISTREIEQIIKENTEVEHAARTKIEVRFFDAHRFIYFHFPNQTVVYDVAASQEVGKPTWHRLRGGVNANAPYSARNFTYVYDRWHCGHREENQIGYLSDTLQSQWGDVVTWEFDIQFIYNEAKGAIVYQLELIPLTGNAVLGEDPAIYTQYTEDGLNYSMPKYVKVGKQGDRIKRVIWRNNGQMRRVRGQKFVGNSNCFMSVARLEATLEGLAW